MSNEHRRLQSIYAQRETYPKNKGLYSHFNLANLFLIQTRERALLTLLKERGYTSAKLSTSKILAVGCGSGTELLNLATYGATSSQIFAIDLLAHRIKEAKVKNSQSGLAQADGRQLPFPDGQFNLLFQFTVFTSVLDSIFKQQIAAEMLRVLRLDGTIIWYDFWANNPNNPNVRGIKPAELKTLFPGCTFDFHRLTLAPPLARRVVPISWLLAELLAKIPPLLTHYLVAIQKGNEE